MTHYLTVEDVERIHALVMEGEPQLRDRSQLEAAVGRPQASAFGSDAYDSLYQKAAALLHSLLLNHPFVDGNKRTGIVATIYFLELNGLKVTWNREEAFAFILDIAQGHHSVDTIADWLTQNTSPL